MNLRYKTGRRAFGAFVAIALSALLAIPAAAASRHSAERSAIHYATVESWSSPPLTDLLALSTVFENLGYWSLDLSRRGRVESLGIDLLLVEAVTGSPRGHFGKFIAVKFGLKPGRAKGPLASDPSEYDFALSAGRVIHGTTSGGVPFAAYIAHHNQAELDTVYSLLTGLNAKITRQTKKRTAWLRSLSGIITPALATEVCSGLTAPSPITDLAKCENSIIGMALARTAGTCAVDALKKLPGEALDFFDGLLTDPAAYWNAAVNRIDRLGEALKNLDFQLMPIIKASKGLSLEAKEEIVCAVAADLAPKVARLGTGVGAASAAILIAESLVKLNQVSKILEGLARATSHLPGGAAASTGIAQALIRGAIACEAN